MNIAFYAPMKPPSAERPSGDRTIARLLVRALERAGAEVRIASDVRTWSGTADADRLAAFRTAAAQERRRLLTLYRGGQATFQPELWLTYHNHYKAPDFLGPGFARSLAIPYVVVEASYAASRVAGPWADWLQEARAGMDAARLIFSFTARDERGLQEIIPPNRLRRLAPFIADSSTPVVREAQASCRPVRLVTVAMMRRGAKEASYRLLAEALSSLCHSDWRLDIVGDGEKANELQPLLKARAGERITFHGRLEGSSLDRILCAADLFVWPGVDEAFGMAYLEAQAHGLAVAACDTAGVGEVVRHGETGLLAPEPTPLAFAKVIDRLIGSAPLRHALGEQARRHVLAHHSIEAAARVLRAELSHLVPRE